MHIQKTIFIVALVLVTIFPTSAKAQASTQKELDVYQRMVGNIQRKLKDTDVAIISYFDFIGSGHTVAAIDVLQWLHSINPDMELELFIIDPDMDTISQRLSFLNIGYHQETQKINLPSGSSIKVLLGFEEYDKQVIQNKERQSLSMTLEDSIYETEIPDGGTIYPVSLAYIMQSEEVLVIPPTGFGKFSGILNDKHKTTTRTYSDLIIPLPSKVRASYSIAEEKSTKVTQKHNDIEHTNITHSTNYLSLVYDALYSISSWFQLDDSENSTAKLSIIIENTALQIAAAYGLQRCKSCPKSSTTSIMSSLAESILSTYPDRTGPFILIDFSQYSVDFSSLEHLENARQVLPAEYVNNSSFSYKTIVLNKESNASIRDAINSLQENDILLVHAPGVARDTFIKSFQRANLFRVHEGANTALLNQALGGYIQVPIRLRDNYYFSTEYNAPWKLSSILQKVAKENNDLDFLLAIPRLSDESTLIEGRNWLQDTSSLLLSSVYSEDISECSIANEKFKVRMKQLMTNPPQSVTMYYQAVQKLSLSPLSNRLLLMLNYLPERFFEQKLTQKDWRQRVVDDWNQ